MMLSLHLWSKLVSSCCIIGKIVKNQTDQAESLDFCWLEVEL